MPFPSPPRGIKAIPWRLPILLFHSGLGWMLGRRFLLLRHIGRKSGKIRYAVLEIIHAPADSRAYYVVSGFGTHSDWYQNIQRHSSVEIQIGRQRFPAQAQVLGPEESAKIFLAYAQRNPGGLRALNQLMGYGIDFSPQGIRAFGAQIPVIQFTPQTDAAGGQLPLPGQ